MIALRTVLSGLALSAGLAAGAASAGVVYDQPGNGAACSPTCWTSDVGADGSGGFQTFGSFSLSTTAAITTVSWQGFYFDFINRDNNPVAPAATTWRLQFYSDASGLPSTALYTATEPAASVATTLIGTDTPFGSPANVYEFTATLPSSFTATAGTTYWFSPLSQDASFNPFFSWSAAASPSTTSLTAQETLPGGAPALTSDDRAFTLSASVPEPATWAMMLVGFGGLGGAMRFRRGTAAKV